MYNNEYYKSTDYGLNHLIWIQFLAKRVQR